jgi:hypothetical protein
VKTVYGHTMKEIGPIVVGSPSLLPIWKQCQVQSPKSGMVYSIQISVATSNTQNISITWKLALIFRTFVIV